MQGPREAKRILAKMRRRYGRKNGVISGALLDHPRLERLIVNSKRSPLATSVVVFDDVSPDAANEGVPSPRPAVVPD